MADTQVARDVWMKSGAVMRFRSSGRGFQGTQFSTKSARGRTNVPRISRASTGSFRVGGTAHR